MRVGSLFSGAGLGDLGLEWAGFEHAWFCEIDDYARKVLNLRWPGVPVYPDIRELRGDEVAPVDVLIGGFPCQDISCAGKGAGIGGERSRLWKEYKRTIFELRPKWVIAENSSRINSRGLDTVLKDFAEIGYDAEWDFVHASAFGLPHKRERFIAVAYPTGNLGNVRVFGEHQEERKIQFQVGRLFSEGRAYWKNESRICRANDGVPNRVDRLRCNGNGVIPYLTYFVGGRIMEIEIGKT